MCCSFSTILHPSLRFSSRRVSGRMYQFDPDTRTRSGRASSAARRSRRLKSAKWAEESWRRHCCSTFSAKGSAESWASRLAVKPIFSKALR